jgi:hypothetical protein
LPTIDQRDIDVPTEKNLQAKRDGRRKTGKLSIPDFRSVENTRVKMIIIASGFRRDQKNPNAELRYLSLNSLTVRFLTSSAYSSNLSERSYRMP